MKTTFTEMKRSLQARWKSEWSREVQLVPVARAFTASMDAVEALARHASEMRQSRKFSQQGLRDEIRTLAVSETVPALKKASADIDRVRQSLAEQRRKLALPQPDPANAAEAIMRSEMRTWLRSLPQTQAVQALLSDNADDRMVQAALEGSPVMSGLTEEMREMVLRQVSIRKYGPEIERIDALEGAVKEAQGALGVSLYQLRQEAMFTSYEDHQFDTWMEAASSAADQAEAEKPSEVFFAEAREVVDEIFAKAFPQLYPDHPAVITTSYSSR